MLLLLVSCSSWRHAPESEPMGQVTREQVAEFQELSVQLRRTFLDRGTAPPPNLSFAPQTRDFDGVRITVAPALAEAQPWNEWPDGTARLFNDGVAFVWNVRIDADRPTRWDPSHTALAVNDTDHVFTAAAAPDDALNHLLQGAALESMLGAPGDLALRARNADGFRQAYLGTRSVTGPNGGVVVFPAPALEMQAVVMELTLGVVTEGTGVRQFEFLFE